LQQWRSTLDPNHCHESKDCSYKQTPDSGHSVTGNQPLCEKRLLTGRTCPTEPFAQHSGLMMSHYL
jgi:hypothetical protein